MIKKSYFCMTKNFTTLLSVAIVVGIIAIFGIPFTAWWFTGDDFHGIFLGYKTKTWSDLLYFFYDGHTNQGVGNPGGYVLSRPDFLGAYYRPLYCIYLALQFWLFGTNGYGYFLCNVTAHALAAGLLFYLIAQYSSRSTAFLTALLFACHPQIAYRFGAVVNFHYYVNVVLVLCIALLLKYYLKNKSSLTLVIALSCYALSLLTRETTIVLPAIIGLLLIAQTYATHKKPDWFLIFKLCLLFGLISVAFLCLRLWLYPIKSMAANGVFLPYGAKTNAMHIKLQECLVFLYDLLFLSWLPWGNKVLKIIILTPLLSLLAYTLFTSRQKFLVSSFFISGMLLLWPGIISFYSPRYIYESMPFFLAGFVTLFATSSLNPQIKYFIKMGITGFILTLIVFTFNSFQAREKKLHIMHQAINKLCAQSSIKDRPLCFLTWPKDGNPCAQIFWILCNNREKKVYFDAVLELTQRDSNIVKPGKWFNEIAPYYDKNFVQCVPIHDGFTCMSLDPTKIIFEPIDIHRKQKIGSVEILAQENKNSITTLNIFIDPTILEQNPLFLNWNYESKAFDLYDALRG